MWNSGRLTNNRDEWAPLPHAESFRTASDRVHPAPVVAQLITPRRRGAQRDRPPGGISATRPNASHNVRGEVISQLNRPCPSGSSSGHSLARTPRRQEPPRDLLLQPH